MGNIDSTDRQENRPENLLKPMQKHVFAGFLNGVAKDKELEIIQTSSLGKSDEIENQGFRVVKVKPNGRVEHKFFALDNSPIDLNLEL